MTSISGQVTSSQNQSSASPSVTTSQTPSSLGAAGPGRSYAIPTNKTSGTINQASAVGGSAHGKSDSISPVNGKSSIPPAVPALGGPTIVNGNNAISPTTTHHSDHSRKPSVTISAAGTSGQMPNGGPVAGKPAAGNRIQFGSHNANMSPNVAHSTPSMGPAASSLAASVGGSNPRITSPQTSPSPIPQPPASGGRPPSSLHGQGPGLNFGSMGGDDGSRRASIPAGNLTPNMQNAHLRRESSHSGHGDMSNGVMGPNGGRGGYPQQGGRGRGYPHPHQQYPQQMSYSPSNSFRAVPNAPRAGQGMATPFVPGARPLAPSYPHSPHQAARSPSLAASQPIPPHPQPGQMPMQNAQIPPQPYYNPQMSQHQGQYMGQPFDPNYGYYGNPAYGMQHQLPMQPHFVPPSPRPPYPVSQGQPSQYVLGQYNQPQPMSRTPSGVGERPPSTVGPPPPSMTPVMGHQPTASRGTNSPAPKSSNFQIPVRKAAGIIIKDPNSGAVKTFDKTSTASPAPSKSPANSVAAGTPPPPPQSKTPSHPEPQHARAESQSVKSNSEKAMEMAAAVRQKIKDDEERERKAQEQRAAGEGKAQPELEAPVTKETEVRAVEEMDEAENGAEPEVEKQAQETGSAGTKAGEKKSVPPEEDEESDEYWARIEAEEARKEEEREAAYQKKKAAENEEKARKDAEEAARADEEMKRAEREAEEAEEARLKKLESGADESKDNETLFAGLKKSENAFMATQTPPTIETPAESGAATPVSDASSSMAPPPRVAGSKQKPAALKLETSKQVEPPQPSAALQSLRSAKFLTAIKDGTYPTAIASPNPALNSAAPMGKFRYDKDFLMQFQRVFVEKPSETWSDKVKETVGDTSETPASARRGGGSGAMTGRTSSNRGSVLPGSGFGGVGGFGAFSSGSRTLPPNTTSEARFAASNKQQPIRYNPSGGSAFPVHFPTAAMSRTTSSTSMGHPSSPRNNTSRRGDRGGSKGGRRENEKDAKTMPLTAGMDLKPIQVSETGWKPRSVGAAANAAGPPPGGDGYLAPDVVQRKVKAALNKMTPSTFDKISTQILEIVSQSQKETDGRTLRQVIGLTFEKATDEAHWAQMYANFCSRMLQYVQGLQPEIKDDTLPLDKNGKINGGGTLFRKYLLNRCQQDFEAGWKAKLPEKPEGGDSAEATMLSDEYYIAAAAKRRGLGLVRFIGELYKLGMLTSRIMHMCVKRLVDFDGMPDEAEVESLTSLLKTIGESLDSEEKARPSMDAYFGRINDMVNVDGLPSRLRFMLMDIIDLRRKGWKNKDAAKGPATLEEIRAQSAAADREKEAQRVADNSRRGGGGGRMNVGRGDARNFSGGNQFMPPPSNTVGMDDLRRLGKGGSRQASSQGPMSLGPTSMFNTRGSNTRKPGGPGILGRAGEDSGASSRTATPPAQREKKEKEEREAATHANAFSALAALDSSEANDHPTSPRSTASSPPVSKARTMLERQRSKSPLKGDDA